VGASGARGTTAVIGLASCGLAFLSPLRGGCGVRRSVEPRRRPSALAGRPPV